MMPEDKQAICDLLCATLQRTRHLWNLEYLRYDGEREVVECRFRTGWTEIVNVECDSGVALILDVMKVLSR